MDTHLYYQQQVFRHQLSKLQAHKSSFQAWKCVSFGYALLATVLLSAKWHEVSTDLRLLNGIDQLLWQTSATNSSSGSPFPVELHLKSANKSNLEHDAEAQWGPTAALVELLAAPPPTNSSLDGAATNVGGAATNSSSEALMSHMQLSLGRELNGNQLLKQEVEIFLAEFRSAKSTLSLSSLLVFVYIISWVLMTMAVNDTRISNDISLRNILLLSVFGAIDMAASIGFVMVRMIMYNVKSSTAVPEILSSASLRDAPFRLSSDQLTAFTALRLIAMRSCSAYVDVYVSVLVALLTLLRFYSIVRAIAYYRFLRRFNDMSRNLHHHHQLTAVLMNQTGEKHHFEPHQQTTLQGFVSQGGAGAGLMRAPTGNWHKTQRHPQQSQDSALSRAGLALSAAFNSQLQQQHYQNAYNQAKQQALQCLESNQSLSTPAEPAKLAMSAKSGGGQEKKQTVVQKEFTFYDDDQQEANREQHQALAAETTQTNENEADIDTHLEDVHKQASRTLVEVAQLDGVNNLHQRMTSITDRRPLYVLSDKLPDGRPKNSRSSEAIKDGHNTLQRSEDTPKLLMVNGRPHKLIEATGGHRKRRLGYDSSAGFESEPVALRALEQRREYLEMRSRSRQRQRSRSRDAQLLLAADQDAVHEDDDEFLLESSGQHAARPSTSHHESFTLLSASQLERLSRNLLANATGSLARGAGHQIVGNSSAASRARRHLILDRSQLMALNTAQGGDGLSSSGKYKFVARYRPVKRPADPTNGEVAQLAAREVAARQSLAGLLTGASTSAASSSSTAATDSDEAPTARVATTPEGGPKLEIPGGGRRMLRDADAKATSSSRRQQARASLGCLRQTEEICLKPTAATTNANRDLLLSKYYYA